MRYMVLGPLRVTRDGEVLPLGGPQQRLVLALLISANGETVSSSNLIEGVWGEEEPATAKKTLQGYIHHLRSQVGDALQTEGGGYSLDTTGAVDALEFAQLRDAGRGAVAADPSNAATLFRNALELWNGPPYADLDGHHALAPEVARLSDLRIAVLGDRIDADLACGGHNGLIGELEGLTQEYPLQERFRGQHMLALHRAGRQVEALRSFERTRRFLGEEMGLEPSADLQRLEQRILAGDEELLLGDAGDPSGRSAVRGYELREVVETGPSRETYRAYQRSVGREVTVDVLGAEIADDPVFIANYLADTQRVAALEHPNIGFVHDSWREPGRAYLVSRWFGGGSLADRLRGESLRMAAAIGVIDQIGAAVSYAHRHGVAHGDLAAANVMLDDEGNAYLTGFVVGSGHEPDLAADRLAFAALTHLLLVGRTPRAVGNELEHDLLGADLPTGVGSVFDVAFEPSAGYGRVEDFLRALRQVLGFDSVVPTSTAADVEPDVRNPYKGLRAFQESDADDFYGRADLIDRLVDRLDHNRLVAVVGPSGSGKSSVVKAGLAARVRTREDGVLHLQTEMFPGAFPFEELEGALLRVGVNRGSVIGDLLADERGLLRVLKQILPSDDSELLLVIDQFEELFSMVSERKVAQLFLASLATAVADPRSRLRVVMTMRADFFDRPLESPEFAALMEAGLVPVSIPDRDGLAAAVSQPALSVGLDFEDGLIDRIVRDLDDQPGGLPLLQYAMTELVEQRTSTLLTFAAYEGIGGVYGALGQRAEDLYQSLKPGAQEALRQAFLRMVSVDESAKDLRRRVTQAELLATEVDHQSLNEALQLFGGHRLLTFDLDPVTRARTVEVAHEALAREWERLDAWITDERDDLVVRRRVDEALAEWEGSGQDPSFLPSGSRLTQFQDWSSSTTLALSSHERGFLDAGGARDDELERRAANRRRIVVVGLTISSVVLAVLATFALGQKQTADETARASETGRLSAEAATVTQSNPRIGLLMAAEAFRREPGPRTLGGLQQSMIGAAPFTSFVDTKATQLEWRGERVFALIEGGIDVVDAASFARTHRFDVSLAQEPPQVLFGNPDIPADVDGLGIPFAATADGSWVGVATTDAQFTLIEIDTERRVVLEFGSEPTSVAFDTRGTMLAIGQLDGSTSVFSVPEMSELAVLEPIDDSRSFAGVPGAEHRTGKNPLYEERSFRVSALAFSDEGDRLALAQGPRVIVISTGTWQRTAGPTTILTTVVGTGLTAGPRLALTPQALWFDADEVVAHGFKYLSFIDAATGEVRFTSEMPTGRSEIEIVPIAVERLPSGASLVLLPDSRLRVIETTPPSEQLGFVERLETESVVVQEIFLTAGVEEALAVDPTGQTWVVAQSDGLVFGSLNGTQLLAQGVPRPEGGGTAGNILQGGLLSIGSDGSIATSDSLVSVLNRKTDEGFRSPQGGQAGTSRFAESGIVGSEDPMLQWKVPRVNVFSSDLQRRDVSVGDFGGLFSLSPDGELLAHVACGALIGDINVDGVACSSSDLRVVDIRDGQVVANLAVDEDPLMIEWHPDGGSLLAVDGIGRIHGWDATDWARLSSGPLDTAVDVAAFRYSSDARLVARVDTAGRIDVLDASGTVRVQLDANRPAVKSVAHAEQPWFSTDNQYLLTSHDRSVRLWDIEAGVQVGGPFPSDIDVLPGGRTGDVLQLVTAVDENLLVWNLDTSTWFDTACQAAGRNMTRAEWDQFGPRDTEYRATCPQYAIDN